MTIKVISATLTTIELELITDTGETIVLPQGHPQVRQLLAKVLPIVNTGGIAIINEEDLQTECLYKKFENNSNGFIKFFKVAKSKLAGLFKEEVEVTLSQSVEEVLQQAQSQSMVGIEDTTVVGVVEGVAIPGMEKLASQFNHALTQRGSPEGMKKFLARLSLVIHKRQHSVEDLLTFLEKADLPIADDGSIIIYKGLNTTENAGIFVDCYSGKVTQKVGSLVYMAESMVDPSRSHECSNGLHVARKGYLSSFGTDVILLGKVYPEDVIAVPAYDASKMRVCAYHLLFVLPSEDAQAVRQSRPMEPSSVGSMMLTDAIRGNHVGITSKVRIGGHMGTNLTLEGFDTPKEEPDLEPTEEFSEPKTIEDVLASEEIEVIPMVTDYVGELADEPVDVVDTVKKVQKVKKGVGKMTRSEEIRMLVSHFKTETDRSARKDILRNIQDLKRTSKKSWDFHEVSQEDAKRLTELFKTL